MYSTAVAALAGSAGDAAEGASADRDVRNAGPVSGGGGRR